MYRNILHMIFIFLLLSSNTLFSQSHFTLSNKQTNFIITYNNVPDSVKNCVQFVTGELQKYIFTSVPINVSVTWTELSSNVSAYAKPSSMICNLNGLPLKDILYPIALAEKILAKNLNYNNPDIEIVINSKISWQANYSNPINENAYDMATILLHECIHGLGMLGNFTKDNGVPTLIGFPTIFDTFITYAKKVKIASLYENGDISKDSLTSLLTSDSLYWSGSYTKAFLGFSPELYAPKQFDFGSSVYHFDELVFPKGNSNSLMTYVLTKGERIHSLGIAVQGMLADIGWTDYYISDFPKSNTINVLQTQQFTLSCQEDLFVPNSQTLLYSYDGGKNYLEKSMDYETINNSYNAIIPVFPFEHTCSYAYRIVTLQNDTLYYPSNFPNHLFSFYVGDDTIAPQIEHNDLKTILIEDLAIEFSAIVTDNFSVDSVYVDYIIGRNDFAQIIKMGKQSMSSQNFGVFSTQVNFEHLQLQEGDMIAYTIVAVDVSSNISYVVPKNSYIFSSFESKKQPLSYFMTDFEHDSIRSYFNLDKFSITKPIGFSSKALHTEHPYSSSGKDLTYKQYIADLKNPIIIASNPAYIEFDEIVLVEPSLVNVEFGEYGFWDYVVVEGVKNKKTDEWKPLGKVGYDSRANSNWLTTFYSALDNEKNSIAVPQESLYRKRKINLLENKFFRTGDTIYIRFRLQSDFIVTGWGWSIDNLKIQERIATNTYSLLNKTNIMYPNPCKNSITIINIDSIYSIQLYTLHGEIVNVELSNRTIDVSNLVPGYYILVIRDISGKVWKEIVIKE